MLVIIDMQKRILDPGDKNYVQAGEDLVPKIQTRLKQAREQKELVFFMRDIPIEHKNASEELVALQIIDELAPTSGELVAKKNYFTLPPEELIAIHSIVETNQQEKERIEVVGVELNLCVLSNTLALQSVFPEANFYIDPELVTGNQLNAEAIALLKAFNIEFS